MGGSAEALASTLSALGYSPPSTATRPTAKPAPPLTRLLEWTYDLEATRPFLDWIASNFQPGGFQRFSVLDELEVQAFEELQKFGLAPASSELPDAQPAKSQDDESMEDIQASIDELNARLKPLHPYLDKLTRQRDMQISLLNDTLEDAKKLRDLNEVLSSNLREQEMLIDRSTLQIDALIKDTVGQAVTLARKAQPEGGNMFLHQSTGALEQLYEEDRILMRELRTAFDQILETDSSDTEDRTRLLRSEIERLTKLYPKSEIDYLDALVAKTRIEARARSIRDDCDRLDMLITDVEAFTSRTDELNAETDAIDEWINQNRSHVLPALLREIAVLSVASPVVRNDCLWKLERVKRVQKDLDKIVRHLVSHHSRHQFLSLAYLCEQKLMGNWRHLLSSLGEELRKKKVEVDRGLQSLESRHFLTTQADQQFVESGDWFLHGLKECLRIEPTLDALEPRKGLHKDVDMPAPTLSSMDTLVEGVEHWIERSSLAETSIETTRAQLKQLLECMREAEKGVLREAYKASTTGMPAFGPKRLYDLQNQVRRLTNDLQPKLRESTKISSFLPEELAVPQEIFKKFYTMDEDEFVGFIKELLPEMDIDRSNGMAGDESS